MDKSKQIPPIINEECRIMVKLTRIWNEAVIQSEEKDKRNAKETFILESESELSSNFRGSCSGDRKKKKKTIPVKNFVVIKKFKRDKERSKGLPSNVFC